MATLAVGYSGSNVTAATVGILDPVGPGHNERDYEAWTSRGRPPTLSPPTGRGMSQVLFRSEHPDQADRHMVDHGLPAPSRGTRLSGESASWSGRRAPMACVYLAIAGPP